VEDTNMYGKETDVSEKQPDVHDEEAKQAADMPTFFELIYGVLFEPVRTFRRASESLPMAGTVAVFSVVNIALLINMYLSVKNIAGSYAGIDYPGTQGMLDAFIPVLLVALLIFMYIKWFLYSGLLFLLAELIGGHGKAAAVLIVTGLASLPGLILLPIQVLISFFGGSSLAIVIDYMFSLAFYSWGVVLVVVGIRETQHFSTARSVFTVFLPAIVIILIILIMLLLSAAVLTPLLNSMGVTGW